jgi:GNAT superfamily N-acetyltransferase
MLSPEGSNTLAIRDACAEDALVIVSFNALLALETEGKTLDERVLTAGVKIALAEPDRIRYWVAERAGQVVGQAAVTREWSDWRNGWIWWLQSVYVAAPYRGRGVFRALYERIRADGLALSDVIGLRLYVEQENLRAQDTYRAVGMVPGGYHVYEELWLDRFNQPTD